MSDSKQGDRKTLPASKLRQVCPVRISRVEFSPIHKAAQLDGVQTSTWIRQKALEAAQDRLDQEDRAREARRGRGMRL